MRKWFLENLIVTSVIKINRLLNPKQRKKSVLMIFQIFSLGVLDVFGLASLLPIIHLSTHQEIIFSNNYLHQIYLFMNFSSPEFFILFIFFMTVLFFIIKNILGVWNNYTQIKFSYEVASNLTSRKLKQFLKLDIIEIVSKNSSVFASNISASPSELSAGLMVPLFSFFSELIVVFLIMIGILIYDLKLLILLALILIPTITIFYRLIRKRTYNMGLNKNNSRYYTFQYLYQIIHGYIDVLLMNKTAHYSKKFLDKNKELNNSLTYLSFYETMPKKSGDLQVFYFN